MEDDPTAGNSHLGGYDEMVLTKNTETTNTFSSHVITTKANKAHSGKSIEALHVEDSSLPQVLMVQNAYTKLRKGSKMLSWE